MTGIQVQPIRHFLSGFLPLATVALFLRGLAGLIWQTVPEAAFLAGLYLAFVWSLHVALTRSIGPEPGSDGQTAIQTILEFRRHRLAYALRFSGIATAILSASLAGLVVAGLGSSIAMGVGGALLAGGCCGATAWWQIGRASHSPGAIRRALIRARVA